VLPRGIYYRGAVSSKAQQRHTCVEALQRSNATVLVRMCVRLNNQSQQ